MFSYQFSNIKIVSMIIENFKSKLDFSQVSPNFEFIQESGF